ncbi:hypothetical protein Q4534_07600 [Cyclobacterium sp. 1_MG-2023]|uniref:hypothetical protein n=1 Tax=Cyclobacterium sp. 1_MG-2023 TaxID=3062681 RepID=UPI0026E2DC62|nr:hypothetical protein [Cyclobacterium sp. 1_MG-2023]MDO6437263.1 hypothetical protein [Cyclobacterium sp. 1_MG-2023]
MERNIKNAPHFNPKYAIAYPIPAEIDLKSGISLLVGDFLGIASLPEKAQEILLHNPNSIIAILSNLCFCRNKKTPRELIKAFRVFFKAYT